MERDLAAIPDNELLRRLAELVRQSRFVEADLVAHIGEVDSRRLYARSASPSMFSYCTEVLHLSEAEAYLRIAAARASRRHPTLLAMLTDGRLHLTAIGRLAPHLTPENREALLERAAHKSKREIEELVAELAPRPDAPTLIRRLPERRARKSSVPDLGSGPDRVAPTLEVRLDAVAVPAKASAMSMCAPSISIPTSGPSPSGVAMLAPELRPNEPEASPRVGRPRPAAVTPLAPGRYKVQFTASPELREKLERLQVLMRSSVPDGDLAAVIEQAVSEKLERLESRRFALARKPRKSVAESSACPKRRRIPAAVRRAVHEREGGRCHYVDDVGRRCAAREGLEFHHRHPFGHGGDHSLENVTLVCRAHNAYLAEADYGRSAMAVHRRSREGISGPTRSASP
jgi:hypothetical protein